jgi:hypothetical protein
MKQKLYVRTDLASGAAVDVRLDDGSIWRTTTRSTPWQLGHGQWVVSLTGKTGGYDLGRVMLPGIKPAGVGP